MKQKKDQQSKWWSTLNNINAASPHKSQRIFQSRAPRLVLVQWKGMRKETVQSLLDIAINSWQSQSPLTEHSHLAFTVILCLWQSFTYHYYKKQQWDLILSSVITAHTGTSKPTFTGTSRPTNLHYIQRRVGGGCRTTWSKGSYFPLLHVMWQPPQWGYSDLHQRNCWWKSEQSSVMLGWLGGGLGSGLSCPGQ